MKPLLRCSFTVALFALLGGAPATGEILVTVDGERIETRGAYVLNDIARQAEQAYAQAGGI